MAKIKSHKQRWIAFLLSMVVMMTALPSLASWQCPDGHLCPPNCQMQHGAFPTGNFDSHSCCKIQKRADSGKASCGLCKNAKTKHAQLKTGCTSSTCVLRMQSKSEMVAVSTFHFTSVSDAPATLPLFTASVVAIEATKSLVFSSPRAPPGRLIPSLSPARAPPVLL